MYSAIPLAIFLMGCDAFIVPQRLKHAITFTDTEKLRLSPKLYNVPPLPSDADSATIKASSDREGPPQSFFQLQINCARAAELAIKDGYKLLEVEVCTLSLC